MKAKSIAKAQSIEGSCQTLKPNVKLNMEFYAAAN